MRLKKSHIILKENLILEDFDSQQELEKMAIEVFKRYLFCIIDDKDMVLKYNRFPKLWFFNSKNPPQYPYEKLKEFVKNYNFQFYFDKSIHGKAEFHAKGDIMGVIIARYDIDVMKEVLSKINPEDERFEQTKALYYAIYDAQMISAILHELQHAYDYYISKGKAMFNKKTDSYFKDGVDANGDPKDISKYEKLQHEVNARFTQAMDALDFSKPLKDFINDFQEVYIWWDRMTPKIKKHLLNRASQYYHKKNGLM